MPVIVKLTPNVTNILGPARAAVRGGADAVSLINTLNSIIAVDLDQMAPTPVVDGKGTHGGYCGPAVKPIALHMVAEIARDPECARHPHLGIGGIESWRDAAEFMALGAGAVQVCTAAMHYGFRIVDDMIDGLGRWMDGKELSQPRRLSAARRCPTSPTGSILNLNYQIVARDRPGSLHQMRPLPHRLRGHRASGDRRQRRHGRAALRGDRRGMRRLQSVPPCLPGRGLHYHGRGRDRDKPHLDWTQHPNNPLRKAAE